MNLLKKGKKGLALLLACGMLFSSSTAKAASTSGGKLGSTTVTCSISINGGSNYSQARLSIETKNKVETLGIKDINIIKKDGGGSTGGSVKETNAYSAVYLGAAYGPNTIKSISGNFYVKSDNFGSFSKNISY